MIPERPIFENSELLFSSAKLPLDHCTDSHSEMTIRTAIHHGNLLAETETHLDVLTTCSFLLGISTFIGIDVRIPHDLTLVNDLVFFLLLLLVGSLAFAGAISFWGLFA